MRKLKLEELGRSGIEEFKNQTKLPVTLLLDSVRSMHNVGSVFRTSDAFAIEQLFLCGITGQPPHREIEKTALGATQSVQWKHFENISDAVNELKAQGYQIVAIEQAENSTKLNEFITEPGKKYALIFGNEVNGVSEEAMALADDCIEIPQFGTKHSFNIVVTAGIVLWDLSTKMSQK